MWKLVAATATNVANSENWGQQALSRIGIGPNEWQQALALLTRAEEFLANPLVRAACLILIVYFTIRVIASVYSGDQQNSEVGPVGIRQHTVQRLDRETIVLPKLLMPMNMDGVSANLKVFYAYNDARGKRRRRLVYGRRNARIAVSPVRLANTTSTIFGHEVPDVATADACFPPVELDNVPNDMPATPDRARDYVTLHKIVENWHEDDNAPLISLHADERDRVGEVREDFIVSAANKVAKAREGNFLLRWFRRGIAINRPNVIGSYYIKLEFSHDPIFVLTRHPDRDLKMTAWLTVLTSMFALVMDAWPKPPATPIEDHATIATHEVRTPVPAAHISTPHRP